MTDTAAEIRARCVFPLWGDHERPTHEYCGEPRRMGPDGPNSPYCDDHSAIAFAGRPVPTGKEFKLFPGGLR